jgi:hypothetical protein
MVLLSDFPGCALGQCGTVFFVEVSFILLCFSALQELVFAVKWTGRGEVGLRPDCGGLWAESY